MNRGLKQLIRENTHLIDTQNYDELFEIITTPSLRFSPEDLTEVTKLIMSVDENMLEKMTLIFPNMFFMTKLPTIPNNIYRIHGNAFRQCAGDKIVLPESVITLDDYAFVACRDVKEVHILNPHCDLTEMSFFGMANLDIYFAAPKSVYSKRLIDFLLYFDNKLHFGNGEVLTRYDVKEEQI